MNVHDPNQNDAMGPLFISNEGDEALMHVNDCPMDI